MESFKYFMKIDIFNDKNKNNNFENHNKNVINKQDEWSLFHIHERKIIIKKNIGKIIGYSGNTISQIRRNNSDTIIKISNNSSSNSNLNESNNINREIILIGPINSLNNTISEIKNIIGEENIIY